MAEEKQVTSVEGENDEGVLSMVDVLEEDQILEAEANAVLGGSDDKYCTYGQGTIGRQALYACTTCITPEMKPAGVCLACSYDCHEGHDLVEMYTKRNFRCDCGNSKFPNLKCKFYTIEDEMIQCIVCEDWYHGRHLGTNPPDNFDYQEMVCTACMKKHDFLWAYTAHSIETKVTKEETTAPVDVESVPEATAPAQSTESAVTSSTLTSKEEQLGAQQVAPPGPVIEGKNEPSSVNGKEEAIEEPSATTQEQAGDGTSRVTERVTESLKADENVDSGKTNDKSAKESTVSQPEAGTSTSRTAGEGTSTSQEAVSTSTTRTASETGTSCTCRLEELKQRDVKVGNHSTFWPQGWRLKLCRCGDCQKMYEDKHVTFLLDESDTVCFYEEKGKSNQAGGTQYEQGMRVFSGMDRVQQVEVLHGYNDMKSELKNYLQSFAEQGKVVTQEDIAAFFETMQARKRQRVDSGPKLQYFCR
ncbi:putative E3 ubiquitin-protein ligase UBR7 isoform X2 [Ptychodera flava]|uniref:putative E3 ubiquitin-protein ligase UBR7 isoform X2 n=1 Tax=Ptychodera flava TaxID=63121 RepID=UPI00396AA2BD